jgi:hypothetical protein
MLASLFKEIIECVDEKDYLAIGTISLVFFIFFPFVILALLIIALFYLLGFIITLPISFFRKNK